MKIWSVVISVMVFSTAALADDTISESVVSEQKQRELAKYLVNKDEAGLNTFFKENLKSIKIGSKSQTGIAVSNRSVLILDESGISFLECLDDDCGLNRPFRNQFTFDSSKNCIKDSVKILSPALKSFEVYKNTPVYLCSFNIQDNAFIAIKKDQNNNYTTEKTEAEILSLIPNELQSAAVTKFIAETFSEIKKTNNDNVAIAEGNKKTDKIKNEGIGIFSKSNEPSCAFRHELANNTFSAVHLWLKKLLGLNEQKAQYAFEIWNEYIQYEHARQTGAVVIKKIKKPDLVVVHISTWADRETMQRTVESKPLRKKLEKLSAAMSVQGQGDFVFFEDYKTVPCGIVAMDFKDVIYVKDIGMVVRGARFYPAKMK